MRKILKVISISLSVVMFCMVVMTNTNTKVYALSIPTEQEYATKILNLQTVYRHGEYWNKYNSVGYEGTGTIACPDSACNSRKYCYYCSCLCGAYVENGSERAWQCMGYAYKIANLVFGYTFYSNSPWEKSYSLGTVYAGDIIRINNDVHSIFVTKVEGDTIYYTDANAIGPCRVRWNGTYTYSQLSSIFTYKLHLPGNTLTGTGNSLVNPEIKLDTSKNTITDNTAQLYTILTKFSGQKVYNNKADEKISAGIFLWKPLEEKPLAPTYQEVFESTGYYETRTSLPINYTIGSGQEVNYTLYPGMEYKYQIFCFVDGTYYETEVGAFTTTGVKPDTTPPLISDVIVSQISLQGYTITCTVTDDNGVAHVQFPTWTTNNGQDDIMQNWQYNGSAATGTISGNTVTYRVNASDHGGETGSYTTHIYATDMFNNTSYYLIPDVYLEDDLSVEEPSINEINVSVSSVNGTSGSDIVVPVTLEDNCGIAGFSMMIYYDSEYMSLYKIEAGDITSSGMLYDSIPDEGDDTGSVKVLWNNTENITTDGVLYYVWFKVNSDIPDGDYSVDIEFNQDDTCNENGEDVYMNCKDGCVSISSVLLGDINLDGKVNNRDAIMLSRYLVGKVTLSDKQINAADVNKDGKVNNRDAIFLSRCLVGKETLN